MRGEVEKESNGRRWNSVENVDGESKRKVALSLSFAAAFGQRISRLRRASLGAVRVSLNRGSVSF